MIAIIGSIFFELFGLYLIFTGCSVAIGGYVFGFAPTPGIMIALVGMAIMILSVSIYYLEITK